MGVPGLRLATGTFPLTPDLRPVARHVPSGSGPFPDGGELFALSSVSPIKPAIPSCKVT